jgi:hypothetical protein
MSDEPYLRAKEIFERLPSPQALERAVAHLAAEGESIPHIRSWAIAIAELHGVWPYARPTFERMMIGAAELAEGVRADD